VVLAEGLEKEVDGEPQDLDPGKDPLRLAYHVEEMIDEEVVQEECAGEDLRQGLDKVSFHLALEVVGSVHVTEALELGLEQALADHMGFLAGVVG
jgi:hypothetical protein